MNLFKTHISEDQRKCLANFLPNGDAWVSKNIPGKNLFNLLLGMSPEMNRVEETMNLIFSEYDITITTLFINEWERALGIPDGCFPGPAEPSIAIRRKHVEIKFSLAIDTRQSFYDLAHALGFEKIKINSGSTCGIYPLPYPFCYFSGPEEAYFTMDVHLEAKYGLKHYPFPEKYPWPYESNNVNIIECLFNKLRPANVRIQFYYDL